MTMYNFQNLKGTKTKEQVECLDILEAQEHCQMLANAWLTDVWFIIADDDQHFENRDGEATPEPGSGRPDPMDLAKDQRERDNHREEVQADIDREDHQ